MAETQPAKRPRQDEEEEEEEEQVQENPSPKRHKDDKQQQITPVSSSHHDPSSILMITSLQQEHEHLSPADLQPDAGADEEDRDQSLRSVMRHLLEASDDELGIPNNNNNNNHNHNNRDDAQLVNPGRAAGDDSAFDFGQYELWELEDEAANYYTVLQSQLFM